MTNLINCFYNYTSYAYSYVANWSTTYSPETFIQAIKAGSTLPPNIAVRGNVNLSEYKGSISLPEGLTVNGDLILNSCKGLTYLPQGLTVNGKLNLEFCENLTSLPHRLTVNGPLKLDYSDGLVSLPDDLTMNGDLHASGCNGLIDLPEGLIVRGDLWLCQSKQLRSLPRGLIVHGDAHLNLCERFSSIPYGLIIHGNLILDCCVSLTSVPYDLKVHGNLSLRQCSNLTSLPRGLTVGKDLRLSYCSNLTSLPQELTVGYSLCLRNCYHLTSLPQDLNVHGDIDLNFCTRLTSLPNWITTLGPCTIGRIRDIYLEGTGLSEVIINRLRETPAPGIRFYISQAAGFPTQIFSNLDEALSFWVKEANDRNLRHHSITIDQHLDKVLDFLSRLTSTAEYKNLQSRPFLARRIIEVFKKMAQEDEIKARAVDLIYHGLASCDDRIISALEEIELMIRIHTIEKSSHTAEELRNLGKSFLLLEMVNQKAKVHIGKLTWIDEIEVFLAFQLGLAERLQLPVNTRNMIFRRSAEITDEQIQQAGTDVLTACTDVKLWNYLNQWSPWIEHQRKNQKISAYEDLPISDRKLDPTEICSLTKISLKNPSPIKNISITMMTLLNVIRRQEKTLSIDLLLISARCTA